MKNLSRHKLLHKDGDSGGLPPESQKGLQKSNRGSKALLALMISTICLTFESPVG